MSITLSIGYPFCEVCPENSVDMGTDRLGMRIAVDWDIKPQTIQKNYRTLAWSHTHTRTHARARARAHAVSEINSLKSICIKKE